MKPTPTDELPYIIVPNSYRNFANRPFYKKNFSISQQQVVKDLIAGKTLLVDAKTSYGATSRSFRRLYTHFAARGYRLRMHLFDDIDLGIYRGTLIWAEKTLHLYQCFMCSKLDIVIGDTKPDRQDCPKDERNHHRWREKKI